VETSITYIVAMRVADLPVPHVPSRKDRCSLCGHEVWISTRLRTKGKALCTRCVPGGAVPDVDPGIREELREAGFSDEAINEALQVLREAVARERH